MFTGLVEAIGRVISFKTIPAGKRLIVAYAFRPFVRLGESIAVNGACLTVVQRRGTHFAVDVIPETLTKTTLSTLTSGDAVNLERSLKFGEPMSGHWVQGHVDGIALLQSITKSSGGVRWQLSPRPRDLLRFIAQKGSVTLHGVSLTVTHVSRTAFEVALIPYTLKHTVLGSLERGDSVNLEVDFLARYVERLLSFKR